MDIPTPTEKADVRCLLGMVNFLASHIPNISTTTAPLKLTHFQWDSQREVALTKIKEVLSSALVLSYLDPSKTSTIQADTRKHGLGACLFQQGKPSIRLQKSFT